MKVSELREVVGRFADLHKSAGSTSKVRSLEALARSISRADKMTVQAMVKKVAAQRSIGKSPGSD